MRLPGAGRRPPANGPPPRRTSRAPGHRKRRRPPEPCAGAMSRRALRLGRTDRSAPTAACSSAPSDEALENLDIAGADRVPLIALADGRLATGTKFSPSRGRGHEAVNVVRKGLRITRVERSGIA